MTMVSTRDVIPPSSVRVAPAYLPPVLSDDRQALLAAERVGIRVRGSPGILVEAKRRGLVTSVAPLLRDLLTKGVWLSEELIARILRELDETG
ncbi:MAG TPA: DUF3368 domain-containing protein [Thermoanaerobaculia bacterium]|nr:DUF3368 domain-containing protein [Thermoanaerobaculia bacterium]